MKKITLLLLSISMLLIANTNQENAKDCSVKELHVSTISDRIAEKQEKRAAKIAERLEQKAAQRLAKQKEREAKIEAIHNMLALKAKERADIKG